MNHRNAIETKHAKTLGVAALTAGALALAAMGSVPTANATCASFFGIGSSGQCTSTLTSIEIAIGTNAEAHADGMLGAALTLGNNSSAATVAGALLNVATTFGDSNSTTAGGLASAAFAADGINQTVIAGVGSFTSGSVGNLAASLAGPEASQILAAGFGNLSVNLAGSGNISGTGIGLTTVNFVGLNNTLTNVGVLNDVTNLSGLNNSVTTTAGSVANFAFNLIGTDNIITTSGVLAVGGTIGSVSQTVSQSGPGFNVNFNRQPAAAALAARSVKAAAPHARTARRSSSA